MLLLWVISQHTVTVNLYIQICITERPYVARLYECESRYEASLVWESVMIYIYKDTSWKNLSILFFELEVWNCGAWIHLLLKHKFLVHSNWLFNCFNSVAYPGIFFGGGGSTNSVQDGRRREQGSTDDSLLVSGSAEFVNEWNPYSY
jgi:hypothetical protein